MKTLNINKMVESGFKVKILMADWFSQMNSEISGNLNKMRTVGRYNIEMWKATGMALDKVDLVWLSDEIRQHGDEYWPIVMDIARTNSVRRIKRYILVWIIWVFKGYFTGEPTDWASDVGSVHAGPLITVYLADFVGVEILMRLEN
jgi:hypothetical protein